jgi:hypothetical protein
MVRRKILSIWSILLILVVSVAVLVPGCEGEIPLGVIEVRATLDGLPWTGAVDYILTPASGSPFGGTSVNKTFIEEPGEWTCEYISGGPGAFVDITPAETQTLAAEETIIFTLNFESCTIEVEATLCDAPWSGAVDYTLTGPGLPVVGTATPASFDVESGNWTCSYDGGGPAGAFLVDITPDLTQGVTGGGNITFTLNFELDQDAWIDWLTWTIDGMPWEFDEAVVEPCQIVDVHFQQGVEGCEERIVAVNETSWLMIHYMQFRDPFTGLPGPPPPEGIQLIVINDYCAVEKSPTPPDKVEQMTSLFGSPIPPYEVIPLPFCVEIILDVETIWMLEKEIDYTKSINWFGISLDVPLPHPCVLFELVIPSDPAYWGFYDFVLIPYAEVELMDDVDVDEDNNYADGPPLLLTVDNSPFL